MTTSSRAESLYEVLKIVALQEAKIKALVEALELLGAAYCEDDMSTREARHRGRVALIKAREAIAAAKETK